MTVTLESRRDFTLETLRRVALEGESVAIGAERPRSHDGGTGLLYGPAR